MSLKSFSIVYPTLPAGYSWSGFTESMDPYRIFYTVRLRKTVKVLGFKLNLPVSSKMGVVARSNQGSLATHMYNTAERIVERKFA